MRPTIVIAGKDYPDNKVIFAKILPTCPEFNINVIIDDSIGSLDSMEPNEVILREVYYRWKDTVIRGLL